MTPAINYEVEVKHDWKTTLLFDQCATMKRFHRPDLDDPTEKQIISLIT